MMTWLQLTICVLVIIAGGGVIIILKRACVVVLDILAYQRDARGDFLIRRNPAGDAWYAGGILIAFGIMLFLTGLLSLLPNLGAFQDTGRLIVSMHSQSIPCRKLALTSPFQRTSVRYRRNPFAMIDCQTFKAVAISIALAGSLGMTLTGA